MRILIAGGAGFLGSHLSRNMLSLGHDVVVVDDLSTGSRANIDDLLSRPRFEFIEADVAEAPSIAVDAIAHLASPASPVDYDAMPVHTMKSNALGMFRLLAVASEQNARLLFVSTSEVYGDPLVHPQPETYWGNVDPVGPRSCYDEAKRFGEALLFATRRETGVQANVVRLFNTYGPDMRQDDGRVIPEMICAASGGNGCQDGAGNPVSGSGETVSVRILYDYTPITPIINDIIGTVPLSGSASMIIH